MSNKTKWEEALKRIETALEELMEVRDEALTEYDELEGRESARAELLEALSEASGIDDIENGVTDLRDMKWPQNF